MKTRNQDHEYASDFSDLVDLSIAEDRTISHFCKTVDEYDGLRHLLLSESDDDCELQPVGGAGYSGDEANGGVEGWGYRENRDGSRDYWKIEIYTSEAE